MKGLVLPLAIVSALTGSSMYPPALAQKSSTVTGTPTRKPGSSGEAIYVGHMEFNRSALVPLPSTGEYTIRVYLMGNDKDAGKYVKYNLDLSIQ